MGRGIMRRAVTHRTHHPTGTVEAWAEALIAEADLARKLAHPPAPEDWTDSPAPLRLAAPGRDPSLRVEKRAKKSPRPGALADPAARTRLVHTFLFHEVQAAELMAWALLAFPGTPRAFRRGLARIAGEELAHARLYAQHLTRLGSAPGAHPVRDWFWERVPTCETPEQFVALFGMGLEGGNLEHAQTFAERFRAVGDEAGACLLERVGREEEAHVRFAATWFRRFTGRTDFAAWRTALPPPLSPLLFRGRPVQRAARLRAGLTAAFVDELESWSEDAPGS